MINKLLCYYSLLFARPAFRLWHKFLLHVALRGLGILNYQTKKIRGEYTWLKSYLTDKNKPLIIDIGANIGNYTKDVLSINQNAEIIAIEPHPITFNKLNENIKTNNIHLYNFAVGDKNGELELFDYANNDGSTHASLYKEVIQDLHKAKTISHKIEVKKLDDILQDNDLDIDLLKIDTEGNEMNVLKGAKSTLKRVKAIHLEFNEMNIISKTFFKDFWDLLNNDFEIFRLLPRGKLLPIKKYSSVECELFHYQNIICLTKK